jgi:hypothetical protein
MQAPQGTRNARLLVRFHAYIARDRIFHVFYYRRPRWLSWARAQLSWKSWFWHQDGTGRTSGSQ